MSELTFLLDANLLIALSISEHEFHNPASNWASGKKLVVCPIVEGALVRTLIRLGESAAIAVELLAANANRYGWIADDISYRSVSFKSVMGHREVTDAYLAALAQQHKMRLATFNEPLAAKYPDTVTLVPKTPNHV